MLRKVLIVLAIALAVFIVLLFVTPDLKEVEVQSENENVPEETTAETQPEDTEEAAIPEETAPEAEAPVVEEEPKEYESVVFEYGQLGFAQVERFYYAKGDKMKAILRYDETESGGHTIDTIYLDRSSRQANAYCEEKGCLDRNKPYDVEFEEYDILSPLEWNAKCKRTNYVGDDVVNKKKTKVYQTNDLKCWIDQYYQLPIKVTDLEGQHYFSIQGLDNVKDTDLAHQELYNYN